MIGEAYYLRGQMIRSALAETYFRKSIDLIETYSWPFLNDPNQNIAAGEGPVFDTTFESMVWYVLGLNHWQLGEWSAAAESFFTSIEADPHYVWAGSMHWLISDCYEKLKKSGEISCEEADPLIEWGYQTLFDGYPDCPDREHAAFELARINMARGRPVTAAIYVNWLLDQPMDRVSRNSIVYRIAGGWEGCGQ